MKLTLVYCWALLLAAPVFSQTPSWVDPRPSAGEPVWFQLGETEAQVRTMLGPPRFVADFGNFRSWQYRIGEGVEHDDFSHALVFRKSDGALISISRTYTEDRNVDDLFPPAATRTYTHDGFSIRVRRLSGGRLLMAMGVAKPGQPTGQIVLIRESELRYFYDWLASSLQQ